MKIKNLIIKLFLSFFIILKSFSTEVIFESNNMDLKNIFNGEINEIKKYIKVS